MDMVYPIRASPTTTQAVPFLSHREGLPSRLSSQLELIEPTTN